MVLPGTLLDSLNVPFTSLGLSTVDTGKLGEHAYYFATPTAYLTDSFFVGYSVNYTWGSVPAGDTVGLAMTDFRSSAPYTFPIAGDTLINDVNAVMYQGSWLDYAYDLGLNSNLFVFPIVDTKDSTHLGVSITSKNFAFYGNYPNPATTSMNIKFSLTNSTNVTIQVMDITGRTINTINENNLSAGEHIVNLATATMVAGDYMYLILVLLKAQVSTASSRLLSNVFQFFIVPG